MRILSSCCVPVLAAMAVSWAVIPRGVAEEQVPEQATVGGKYSNLVRVVSMPEEEKRYGKFHDFGPWKGGRWGNYENLPAGYWVYVAPNWYVWKDSKAAGMLPPRVVKVDPAEGATGVDLGRKQVSVTFDRPMTTEKAWSWMLLRAHGLYPGVRGGPEPQFDETGKTCTLTVSLQERAVYAVGINSFRHLGFRDRNGIPALNFGWAFATGDCKPEDLPPRVVKTSPEQGADGVEPNLKEISVTFDRPMRNNTWSWVLQPQRGEFPGAADGKPSFVEDGLTCRLPVSLKPDTVYAVSINSYEHTGFKSQSGTPALPFGLAFKTRK